MEKEKNWKELQNESRYTFVLCSGVKLKILLLNFGHHTVGRKPISKEELSVWSQSNYLYKSSSVSSN